MKHINYTKMNAAQRHSFNSTGYADKSFIMSESDFNMLVEKLVSEQVTLQEFSEENFEEVV